jgi:hypothetical protein
MFWAVGVVAGKSEMGNDAAATAVVHDFAYSA